MKALAILFRIIFSAIVLLALSVYLQVSPTITLGQFCDALTPEALGSILGGVNTVTVSLAIIVLLGIFSCTRILEAIWNVLFCSSILILLAGGLYTAFGASVALPNAIFHNEAINQLCQVLPDYQVLIALVSFIFVAGWLCAPASVRIAITSVISYGLWYGVTELFSYIVYLWAGSSNPALPEALNMIQSTPWVIAAVPAAFFLIYALLMAFFETFISHTTLSKHESTMPNQKDEEKPAEQPKAKVKPAAQPKTQEKAEEKTAEQPETKEKAEEKPAEQTEAKEKVEEKPAEQTEAKEKAEEKPAEQTEAKEKAEEKPAEQTEAKEKAEEKPAEQAEAKEKAEEKPAEQTEAKEKVEEKPAEQTEAKEKAEEKPAEQTEAAK